MKIGNCKDIDQHQGGANNHQLRQLTIALMSGHIITANGDEFRFARKDQELFEKGDQYFVAMETGMYKRMYEFKSNAPEHTPEHASGFRWMGVWGDTFEAIERIYQSMSEDEITIALSNFALDEVTNNRKSPRKVPSSA